MIDIDRLRSHWFQFAFWSNDATLNAIFPDPYAHNEMGLRFHVVRVASLLSKILSFIFDGLITSKFLAIGRSTFATWF